MQQRRRRPMATLAAVAALAALAASAALQHHRRRVRQTLKTFQFVLSKVALFVFPKSFDFVQNKFRPFLVSFVWLEIVEKTCSHKSFKNTFQREKRVGGFASVLVRWSLSSRRVFKEHSHIVYQQCSAHQRTNGTTNNAA